jgi:hypothetical protein
MKSLQQLKNLKTNRKPLFCPQVREDCRKFDGTMFGNQALEHNMNHAMLD